MSSIGGGREACHSTGLHFPDDLALHTVQDRVSNEPIVSIHGGWLGWPANVDFRNATAPPSEIFIILLPTTNSASELIDFGGLFPQLQASGRDRFESPDWRPFFVNGTINDSAYSSVELKRQFYYLATRSLLSTESTTFASGRCVDIDISISFPERHVAGSSTMRLCADRRACERASSRPSSGNVAMCVPAVDNVLEWRYSLPQYIAWYIVHHAFAHIYIYARPHDAHSPVWKPFIASGRVTVYALPLTPVPSSWHQLRVVSNVRCGVCESLSAPD